MKLIKAIGATSEIWQIFIMDSSSSTGAGLAGLVFNSAGLTAYYHRDTDTTATAITLVTMTVGTFTSSGFKEIDATNMPGWYQFCPPNAALASGAKSCGFHLKGATNMAPLPIEVQLVAYNPEDAVRLGLTALPNAAAEAAGGLYTRGTGAGQINQPANGNIDANVKTWLGGTIPAVTVTGVPLVDVKYILGTISPAPVGSVAVSSNIKKNASGRITFVMTDSTTHAPKTGCTVTSQVSLDGAALASCTNSASEIGSGLYTLVLAAADTNANELAYRFTASSADDLVIERVTQP
jgi:hypothetical protein